MKKAILLFLLFLVSCQGRQMNLSDLEYSDQCPHLCWMGINPGVTPWEDAIEFLNRSSQIDQKWLQISDESICADWPAGVQKDLPSTIGMTSEDGLVKTISLGPLPFTMSDFFELLGEPDQIIMWVDRGPEYENIIYHVYYLTQKILIGVRDMDWNGPEPTDPIEGLYLNYGIDDMGIPPEFGQFQSWLGFGHLHEYLPGVEVPFEKNPIGP